MSPEDEETNTAPDDVADHENWYIDDPSIYSTQPNNPHDTLNTIIPSTSFNNPTQTNTSPNIPFPLQQQAQ